MDRRQFASPRPTWHTNNERNGSPPRGRPPDGRSSSGAGRPILPGAVGIAIPGKARPASPPPPLPPPRFAPMEGEAAGSNPGWAPAWGSDLSRGFGRRQSNDAYLESLAKGPNANSAPELACRGERQNSRSTFASTGDSERGCTFSRIDEGYWSLPASNPVNQQSVPSSSLFSQRRCPLLGLALPPQPYMLHCTVIILRDTLYSTERSLFFAASGIMKWTCLTTSRLWLTRLIVCRVNADYIIRIRRSLRRLMIINYYRNWEGLKRRLAVALSGA